MIFFGKQLSIKVLTMRSIADYFHRPAFSLVNKNTTEIRDTAASSSSPLTEPPPSSFLEQIPRETPSDDSPQVSVPETTSTSHLAAPQQSFQSTESAAAQSSLSRSFHASHRIVKGGKEVVISSDGDDTDFSSLDDTEDFLKPKGKQDKDELSAMRTNKALLADTSAPKYKNTIDSLVHDAVGDNEVEANVARVKAAFQSNDDGTAGAGPSTTEAGQGLHEDMLTSTLGDGEDGGGLRRLLDALRRTEALEQDRVWRFFTQDEPLPPAPEFPRDLIAPGTYMDVLRGLFCISNRLHSC